ncbi:hypothetical protein [Hymenobacter sp. YC55]|uniref:hypothetical protein n=1 Tax=Hymenobacter sp. YC55 TaxID=3034019 RepID=UPI0023F71050|nr:hypothetical protein [Hymenobacter sp. YC55]MDF7810917.1 hypothetical protein [Hymenobacter sp. YC55]
MHTYDDEIYTYLTQPENYRSAKQIASQLGAVDERLIIDFWQALKVELEQQLSSTGFEVELITGELFSVHQSAWNGMGLGCDFLNTEPDMGIHCDPDEFDRAKVDVLLDAAKVRQKENMSKRSDPWPCYRHLTEYDFRQQQTLERILPGRREESIKNMAALFTDFIDKYGDLLNRINKEARIDLTA